MVAILLAPRGLSENPREVPCAGGTISVQRDSLRLVGL